MCALCMNIIVVKMHIFQGISNIFLDKINEELKNVNKNNSKGMSIFCILLPRINIITNVIVHLFLCDKFVIVNTTLTKN